ncbi:MAG: hypothetical protein QM786_12240 [Breznakibacter sp.]
MKKTRLLWLVSLALVAINLFFYLTLASGHDVIKYVSNLLPIITSFIALICLGAAFKSFKELDLTKISWLLIGLGTFFNLMAETTYATLDLHYHMDMNKVYPTLADFFWCAAYIPLFAGIFSMFVAYKNSGFPMGELRIYILFGVVFIATSVSIMLFLLIPVIKDPNTELFAKIFYLFYPIADLILVAPSVILMYITCLFGKGIISRPLRYLAVGFILMTVADLLFAVLNWQGAYSGGNFIDVGWNMGYLSIGLAALYQKELIDNLN